MVAAAAAVHRLLGPAGVEWPQRRTGRGSEDTLQGWNWWGWDGSSGEDTPPPRAGGSGRAVAGGGGGGGWLRDRPADQRLEAAARSPYDLGSPSPLSPAHIRSMSTNTNTCEPSCLWKVAGFARYYRAKKIINLEIN